MTGGSEPPVLIDTHAHLDMLDDLEGALDRARAAGVADIVTIGVDARSSRWAAEATARPGVWATAGLHPHDAKDWTPAIAAELEALAGQPRVVGIGEAGLDYHYDRSPRDMQREVFAHQVRLTHRTRLALVIHCRDAFPDVFAILESEGVPARTVFHCWSGGPAEAERALGMGAVLSFSGTVTFKNAEAVREAALMAPLDRVVVETDAPFLAPVPVRGRPNEPAFARHTADFLSRARGIPLRDLVEATTRTARGLFQIPG